MGEVIFFFTVPRTVPCDACQVTFVPGASARPERFLVGGRFLAEGFLVPVFFPAFRAGAFVEDLAGGFDFERGMDFFAAIFS